MVFTLDFHEEYDEIVLEFEAEFTNAVDLIGLFEFW